MMKDIVSSSSLSSGLSSSSSSSSEEENKKRVKDEEDEEEDMMTMSRFTQSWRSSTSSVTPQTHHPSKVGLDHSEAPTSQRRAIAGQNKAMSCAIERAEEVQANLDPVFPSFVKSMSPSHVNGEYRLGLPVHFGKYLPNELVMINLIDENQREFSVKFLTSKKAFSIGWKDFCIANTLVAGDALVFQLVKPTEFQVYIVRAYSKAEINGVISLHNLDARREEIRSCKRSKTSERTEERSQKNFPLATPQQPSVRTSKTDSGEVGSEVIKRIRFLGPKVKFQDIENPESFTIAVNGLNIDSELSEQVRSKYYELCRSQKAPLHQNLMEATNCTLAAGLISQTIKIADSIRASKLSTTRNEFATWDKSLGAFEELGMNVGFLRARIKKLVSLIFESDAGVDSNKYREAITARDDVKKEIRAVKAKLVELQNASKRFDIEIETLKMKVENLEGKFRAEVDALW